MLPFSHCHQVQDIKSDAYGVALSVLYSKLFTERYTLHAALSSFEVVQTSHET